MRSRDDACPPSGSPSSAAPAQVPGKRTRAEDGETPRGGRDSEAPRVVEGGRGEEPEAPGEGAPSWEADGELMGALGLPELASMESAASSEATSGASSGAASAAPASRHARKYVSIAVAVPRVLSAPAFQARALQQALGSADVDVRWSGLRDRYDPGGSPFTVLFEEQLLLRARGQASAARGIDSDEHGEVAGAAARAAELEAQPDSVEKSALLAEVDRRYRAAVGPSGERARDSALWRRIRDEVLFQQQHLAQLPGSMQRAIRLAVGARELGPRDYDQLFSIAQKLALLPPADLADFAAKISGEADLAALDADVDAYFTERAEREQASAERTAVQDKLLGLDEVYRLYLRYQDNEVTDEASPLLARGAAYTSKQLGLGGATAEELRPRLERELARHGFASIAEFRAHVGRLEQLFEEGALRITFEVLARYGGTLHREALRYREPAVVAALHQRLSGFRGSYHEYQANAAVVETRNARRSTLEAADSATTAPAAERANAAREAAVEQIRELSAEYPILGEDELPIEERLDKVRLARASEAELPALLQAHLARRLAAVAAARSQLEARPALVYKLDRLMPEFYAQLGIQPGSVHDQILQDKLRSDAIAKLLGGLALAVVTVALSAISFGAAAPPLLAAGAAAGAAGLSAHAAYAELESYTAEGVLASAGLADEPSVAWLAASLVGAGVDLAAATAALRALAPAARALAAGGAADDFTRAVQALQASQQLDERIAVAARQAASARAAYSSAKLELSRGLAKAYAFPGPLTDPAVARSLLQMAVAKLKQGAHSLAGFLDELKQARLADKLAELSPEDLTAAKDVWERAQVLAPLLDDAAHLAPLLAKIPDPTVLQRLLRVFPSGELVTIAAALDEPAKLTVMVEHLGEANTGKLMRQWMKGEELSKANNFLKNLSSGVRQDTMKWKPLEDSTHIIDTNAEVAMSKARRGEAMNEGEKARVDHINRLPNNADLRLANVSLGESENSLGLKGFSLTTDRDSPEYLALLNKLENANVGKPGGYADRAIIADAFFASAEKITDIPRLLTSDSNIIKKLAKLAGIDPNKIGGYKALVQMYEGVGFRVSINGRSLIVIPSS